MKSLILGMAILVAAMPLVARAEFESSSEGPAAESRDKPHAWGVSIRPFMGYDDNVQLVPDQTFFEGDTSSFFGGLNVDGRVRIFDDDRGGRPRGEHLVLQGAVAFHARYERRPEGLQPGGRSSDGVGDLSERGAE